MHHAILSNNIEAVKCLLEAGARIDLSATYEIRPSGEILNCTPLQLAKYLNHQGIIKFLQEAEKKLSATSQHGSSNNDNYPSSQEVNTKNEKERVSLDIIQEKVQACQKKLTKILEEEIKYVSFKAKPVYQTYLTNIKAARTLEELIDLARDACDKLANNTPQTKTSPFFNNPILKKKLSKLIEKYSTLLASSYREDLTP